MKIIDLNGKWNGRCIYRDGTGFEYIANVPGSAISDLISDGKLPEDIFLEKNADKVSEYENCDYIYKTEFDYIDNSSNVFLYFDRIDTYADVYLNGEKIYHSENGNISHEICVKGSLKNSKNELEIRLYSPIEWVKDRPLRRGAFTCERMNTRRMQCTYGWDWVARFVTVGLGICHIKIYGEDEARIDSVYIVTTDTDEECANIRADVSFIGDYKGRIFSTKILDPDGKTVYFSERFCAEEFMRIDMDIPAPKLWYPAGYGNQPLYTFILADGNEVLYKERFGIRTVKIVQIPDQKGSTSYEKCLYIKNKDYDFNESFSGFTLKVNGEKVFCRGANWVPCVPFNVGDVSKRQTEILELCAEAGVNMLRIWGGGAFETEHFYDECTRLGIMVTQDFLMACGAYPEDEDWFIEELKKEALYASHLIRNKTCLMWWSGDNENAVDGCDTDENYMGRRSAYCGIAPVLYKEDPYRRFLPSSPYGGKKYASNTVGTTHNTQYLGEFFKYFLKDDLSDYKEEFKKYRARFIAEEPQMGAVSYETLKRFMNDSSIFEGDEMWLYHTKNNPGLGRELFEYTSDLARKVLGEFKDGQDRLFKLQYIQYEWIRVVTEQARREKDLCSGIIFWMMNDCWPAASGWAIIDYYNNPKNAFYAFKRCSKDIISSIDRDKDKYLVYTINDGMKDISADCEVLHFASDRKTVLNSYNFKCNVCKNSSNCVFETDTPLLDGEFLVCNVKSGETKDRSFYKNGDLKLVECKAEIHLVSENVLSVSADEYVHALVLNGEAVFEDNCFSLLPGEIRTISFKSKDGYDSNDIYVYAYTLE